ncbi:MAG: hypothetical protein CL762_04955, partial [Chloroflexi bacterium]|nr:hypothetical protein [Chloroflexota bacterium]
ENTGPEYWQIGMMDIHRGIGMPTYFITGGKNHPQSIGSVLSFDWGPNPEKNTRSQSQGTKINPGGTKNNMDDFDEERRIKQNELENEMRRLEEEQRRKRQEMDMELQKRQDLTREEENRLRREVDMEMERERMEMERERMEMDMEMRMEMDKMERERMEQQREMMREMDGSGGRDDFFQPDEKCFVEDEEEGRGLFGNISIGSEVDCNETEGMQQRLSDPTTLAMLGLVVTVGATMLQMFRGN